MRTICKAVYKFSELSEQAKQKAINDYREHVVNTDYIYDEAYQTVRKFHEIFGTKEGNGSWLDFSTSHIDDNVLELKGIRLRTYIENNFGKHLTEGKYFSLWSKKDVTFKHYKDGHPVLKSRYSKVIFTRDCPLTGVCYDMSILQPIYEFLDWKLRPDYNSTLTFEELISDCFQSLENDIESEVEARHSDNCIIEDIEANEYEFNEDGTRA